MTNYERIMANCVAKTGTEKILIMSIEEMAHDRVRLSLAADDRAHDEYEGDFGSIAVDSYPTRDMAAHAAFLREIKWLQQEINTMKTMNDLECMAKMFDAISKLGWVFSVPTDFVAGSATEFDIENYSPAGEDLIFTLSFDGTPEGLAAETDELYESFDVDEHVKMWIEAKDHGISGIPNSIEALVVDAKKIDEMLRDMDRIIANRLDDMTEAEK